MPLSVHCDAPRCDRSIAAPTSGKVPMGFLRVTGDRDPLHFCSWECVRRHALRLEALETVDAAIDRAASTLDPAIRATRRAPRHRPGDDRVTW